MDLPVDQTSVDQLWGEFRAVTGVVADLAGSFAFGDSPGLADELADLVRNGPKRATAGQVWEFERDGDPVPLPGDYWVVLDGRGQAACVIQTTEVQIKPLNQVDDAFAWDEGEGDRSLTYWMDAHRRYFMRQCEQAGVSFADDLPTVFERFDLVWPEPGTR